MADDIQAQLKKAAQASSYDDARPTAIPSEMIKNEELTGSQPSRSAQGAVNSSILQKQLQNIQEGIAEKDIAREARETGMKYISLKQIPLRSDTLHFLTREEVERGELAVFNKVGNVLHVACVKPDTTETQNIIQSLERKNLTTVLYLCSKESIEHALNVYAVGEATKKVELSSTLGENIPQMDASGQFDTQKLREHLVSLTTSTEILNYIHLLATQFGSSDIHIEPTEKNVVLRFRVDGILRTILNFGTEIFKKIIVQIKHDAGLKINVDTIPQDGEYAFKYENRNVRVRVSTLPTDHGESVTLRLLDSERALTDFDALGFEDGNLLTLQNALRASYGMILVTGPTGSGKTTTLYTSLRHLSTSENKVITLEDPMEYSLSGIVQSEVHPEDGYTFETGLKSILRQDPDVIMIGEIRDFPSAETAAQSALTGHVVLSTLHTNTALEAIPRLLNIGLKPFVLAPALHTIVAQRLIRVLDDSTKFERDLTDSEKKEIEAALPRIQKIRPNGNYTMPTKVFDAKGFKGRTVITEVIGLDEELKNLIAENVSPHEFEQKVIQDKNVLFMKEDGIIKVLEGKTTLAEVLRVVG